MSMRERDIPGIVVSQYRTRYLVRQIPEYNEGMTVTMFKRTLLSPPRFLEEQERFRPSAMYTVGRFPFRVDRIGVRRITQQVLLLSGRR